MSQDQNKQDSSTKLTPLTIKICGVLDQVDCVRFKNRATKTAMQFAERHCPEAAEIEALANLQQCTVEQLLETAASHCNKATGLHFALSVLSYTK